MKAKWFQQSSARSTISVWSFAVAWFAASTAWGGMPSLTLTDAASARLEVISFFLMVLLISALCVKLIWNRLRVDFPQLPRLSFLRSCGVVTLWGLLFIIVLTMISGARELMTPGAWKKVGYTYALAENVDDTEMSKHRANSAIEVERRRCHLESLGIELRQYAIKHEGKFPAKGSDEAISADLWKLPLPYPSNYVYMNHRSIHEEKTPLAFEPDVCVGEPWVYFTDGTMRRLPRPELLRQIKGAAP